MCEATSRLMKSMSSIHIHQWLFYCSNAFCQADLDEEVFVRIPKLFEKPGPVFRMKQRLSRLRQSPKNFQTLSEPWNRGLVNMIPVCLILRSTSPSLKVLWYRNYSSTYHITFLYFTCLPPGVAASRNPTFSVTS